ncbi:YegP family protein [Pseudocitrobacter vendiensis]|uniref:DUF1508 domain-containing protein n=1 Tax=Pseudocitrobacter vendiensis TaxID=2488306 RepID=A0ABN8TEG4_9ENTR|nr:YegP family protein [Pseudocitrobacter vendiensis]CAH6660002.1 DUF1508 domain-containing protein [Pseudocitrobacter vendiensis]
MGYYVLKKSEKDVAQPWYFLLKADNHETIATSEMYSSKDAAKKGIASVQKNGASETIKDDTAK